MENHVKTYIKAVKVYCKPLQGEKYQTLERKLKAVAEEIDKKKKTSTEIHTAISSYEDYLLQNLKEKFERVARDKTYQDSRKHLTPLPLPGYGEQLRTDLVRERNERRTEQEQVSQVPLKAAQVAITVKTSGNGTRANQGEEDVTPPNHSSDVEEWRKKLTEKEDELNDLKSQLMNLAKECDIDEETPQTIITKTIRELKDRGRERKPQDQTKGNIKEMETNLDEVKKSVFKVKKVKDGEHDIEKTMAKIQDLHRQEEELLKLKRVVFTPNKGKDEVRSTEDTMQRVSELQRQEEELLKLKRAVSNPNKGKDEIHSTEDTMQRMYELQRSKTELLELKKITFDEELMKAAFDGKQDGIKDTLDNARVMVQKLKRARYDLRLLLEAVLDSEDPFTTNAAVMKVLQLKTSVREKSEIIQHQKSACEQLEKNVSEKEKRYNSLMRDKEDMALSLNNEIKRLQRERDDLLKKGYLEPPGRDLCTLFLMVLMRCGKSEKK